MGERYLRDRQLIDASDYVLFGTAVVTSTSFSRGVDAANNGSYIDTVVVALPSSTTTLGAFTILDGSTPIFAWPKQAAGNTQFLYSYNLGIQAQTTQGFCITVPTTGFSIAITGRF